MLGGLGITLLPFIIAGIYVVFSGPAHSQITPDDENTAIQRGYIIYLFIIGVLMTYMVQKKGTSQMIYFFVIIAILLVIISVIWRTAPLISLIILFIIASWTVQRSLVA